MRSRPPLSRVLLLAPLLSLAALSGCTGSGAVNPLTPNNQTKPDAANAETSDVLYWTPEKPDFALTDSLNGVVLLTPKLGWACGNNGTVLKYDGEKWTKVETGLAKNENLLGLAFSGENDGWMVGSHGTLLSFRNGAWTLDASPTQEALYDVAAAGSRTAWACGANGTLLTYNGVSWGRVPVVEEVQGSSPATVVDDLYGLDLTDPNNGWAVGARGRMLRFDGAHWTPAPSNTTERLNSVHALNGVQAWAVGAFGTILRYNGTTWNRMGSSAAGGDLYRVRFRREDDGWVVGQDGTLLYYDGTKWITHPRPAGKPSLNALTFLKDDGFVVGSNGTLLRFHAGGDGAAAALQFKGQAVQTPGTGSQTWTLAYQLTNKGQRATGFLTFESKLPKGLEAYQEAAKPTPAAAPDNGPTAPGSTPLPTAVPTVPVLRAGPLPAAQWTLKGGTVTWDLGVLSPSESKSVTLLLRGKKDEKWDLPLVIKADLKQPDHPNLDAAPLTLLSAPASPVPTPSAPAPTPTAAKGN